MIEAVSEMTRYNFGQVYDMPAIEFFAYIKYINIKRQKEYMRKRKEAEEFKRRSRRH